MNRSPNQFLYRDTYWERHAELQDTNPHVNVVTQYIHLKERLNNINFSCAAIVVVAMALYFYH